MPSKILLVTAGWSHPPLLGRLELWRTLSGLNWASFRHVGSLEALPANLNGLAALVIYIHHKTISDKALQALDSFVSGGGGLLAVHSATASFKQTPHYFEILGGRFTGHGPVQPFEVIPVPGDEIFDAIPAFRVRDELYLHELQEDIQPHFFARHEGEDVPVVWTRRYGVGRVCYACPGHRTETMRHPVYRQVLKRGLVWVSDK